MQIAGNGRLRRRRQIALLVLAGLLLLLTLGWFFPARWALAWLTPSLHGLRLQEVHGVLWDGRADQVLLPDGRVLGRVHWKLSRRAVFAPAPVQMDFAGPQMTFSGSLLAQPHRRVRLDHVRLRVDLALWRPQAPPALGQPRGELSTTLDHGVLQDGWPLEFDLRAHWRDAALLTSHGNVALGTLDLSATAHAGVIDASVSDVDDGPLQVNGSLRLSPLGWWLDLRLRERCANPRLQRWLASLGTTDATGTVYVQRRGGLAPMPPVAPTPIGSAVHSTRTQQGQP